MSATGPMPLELRDYCPAFQNPPLPCPLEYTDCQERHIHHSRAENLNAFLDLYADGRRSTAHTHGGNRFWVFEGTSFVFCSACALGLPPDPIRR